MTAQTHWADMPLFEGRTSGLPYQPHRQTSVLAAGVAKHSAASIKDHMLDLIYATPEGLTDMQIQDIMQLDGSTQRPRRGELLDEGRIKNVGTRRNKRGHPVLVWGLV